MPEPIQSTTAVNRLAAFLAERGLSAEQFAADTGSDVALVRQLCDQPRLLPDMVLLEGVWRAYQADPGPLVAQEPLTPGALPGFDANHPLAVAIAGAGNLGHVFAGRLSARGDTHVRLLTSTEDRARLLNERCEANGGITVSSRDGAVTGRPALISADPAEAATGAHLVLVCVPSFLHEEALCRVLPHLAPDALVGVVPAPGGLDWKARHLLAGVERAPTVFGVGVIPWMCKLVEAGREVRVLGAKRQNALATINCRRSAEISDLIGALCDQPFLNAGSFLNFTLNPGNQLLHPAIMYDLFAEWNGEPLAEPPLLYEDLSESAAGLLAEMSDELMAIRAALETHIPGLRLPIVLPLQLSILLGYGADVADPRSLRSIVASNRAYATIRAPMVCLVGGWAPDWGSRFFTEDVPHGLVVLHGLAELAGVTVPAIDRVLDWAQQRMGCEYLVDGRLTGADVARSGAPQRFGIKSLSELAA